MLHCGYALGGGRSLRYAVAAATPSVPISLDPADATLARELAAKTGESFWDFVRRVVIRRSSLRRLPDGLCGPLLQWGHGVRTEMAVAM